MSTDVKLLINLTDSLNKTTPIINSIIALTKNEFSQNDEFIAVSIGIISEIKECGLKLSDDLCFVNQDLYRAFGAIISYSNSLFDKNRLVNTCKLYDCIKVNILNLMSQLNSLNQENK